MLISYLKEHEEAQETARWVEEAGRKAIVVPGDVAAEQHCNSLVDRAISDFGQLSILVNNAAMQRTHERIEDITAEEWDGTFSAPIFIRSSTCARRRSRT